jgi:hypothetical protein
VVRWGSETRVEVVLDLPPWTEVVRETGSLLFVSCSAKQVWAHFLADKAIFALLLSTSGAGNDLLRACFLQGSEPVIPFQSDKQDLQWPNERLRGRLNIK